MRKWAVVTMVLLVSLIPVVTPAPWQAKLPFITGNGSLFLLIEPDGSVKVWGDATYMSLGDGIRKTNLRTWEPLPLPSVRNAVSAAVGDSHALILLQNGTVLAWGENAACEVGNGDPARKMKPGEDIPSARTPVPVTGLSNVVQVSAGKGSSGAILDDGTVKMWGGYRMLGNLPTDDLETSVGCAAVPIKVPGLTAIKQLALGTSHVLALREDGKIFAWGMNRSGELGDGTQQARGRPAEVQGITNAVSVAAGVDMSAAVLRDGTVRTWGENSNGQLGDPVTNSDDPEKKCHLTPYRVPGITTAQSLQMGLGFVMVQLKDGTLRGWGEGYYGGLGNGSSGDWFTRPQTPKGLGPVLRYYVISRRVLAIRADGTVMGWGPLDMMTLGGRKGNVTLPVPVFKISMTP